MKIKIDLEEIKKRPNDFDLGSYVREKGKNMKDKDLVVSIMKDWYLAMDKHGISVQPKASTILGTVLAKHLNADEKDVFDIYMNTNAGEMDEFWQSLTQDEKQYVEKRRQEMRDQYYADKGLLDDSKQLLKG